MDASSKISGEADVQILVVAIRLPDSCERREDQCQQRKAFRVAARFFVLSTSADRFADHLSKR